MSRSAYRNTTEVASSWMQKALADCGPGQACQKRHKRHLDVNSETNGTAHLTSMKNDYCSSKYVVQSQTGWGIIITHIKDSSMVPPELLQ